MDERTADILIVAARESLIHVRHDMADLQAQIANLDARRPEVRLP